MKRFKTQKAYLVFMSIMTVFMVLPGCGGGVAGGGSWDKPIPSTVTVVSTIPANGATGVYTNTKVISATFSGAMDPTTITTSTFTLKQGTTDVSGTVTYSGVTAVFKPSNLLLINTKYTATITTGTRDLTGYALPSNYEWSFTTGAVAGNTPPTVTNTVPANAAGGVLINTKAITATFSEEMDQSTINLITITLQKSGPPLGAKIAGTATYNPLTKTATFSPTVDLTPDTLYTVTVTNGAKDLVGNALVVPAGGGLKPNPWTFRTATASVPVIGINLGKATTFGIAATAGVTNTKTAPLTTISGDVVLDPVSGATCNGVAVNNAGGFGLCGSTTPTSTPILNGKVYSAYFVPVGGPSPTDVVTDLKAAYLSITPPAGPPAAGSLGGATNLPAGTTLGAPTGSALVPEDNYFTPGVYQSLTSILITGDLTLDGQGDPNALFIFQSSSTVGTADGAVSPGTRTRILLINGAKASNVWWQAGTSATLGLYSEFQGNILAAADITMKTGATSCGRLLAGAFTSGAFVFNANVVSVPGQSFAPPAGYSTTCQ